jgi:S1-C subfamily serine protease
LSKKVFFLADGDSGAAGYKKASDIDDASVGEKIYRNTQTHSMSLRKIEENVFAGALRPVVTLSAALVISLTVLGGLSLRQHRQIQELRQANQEQNHPPLQTQPNVVNQLTRPPCFDVQRTEDQQHRSEQIISQLSRGVCLIQGEYIFVDPKTEKPLRYMDLADAAETAPANRNEIYAELPPRTVEPVLSVSINGKGRLLKVPFTGTGFLVDERGFILTNKHVTEPWLISREYRHILSAGYIGKLSVFRAFFGGYPAPFDVQVAKVSKSEDVALLQADLNGTGIPVLPCEQDRNQLKAGQTVIVLGYPTGFDVLLARLSSPGTKAVVEDGGSTLEDFALTMAQRGVIWPIGTRGMCGRVGEDKIIYDAPTAIGGSGGPVIGLDGKVVAINTALLRGFAGTNFGIPIQMGLHLLEQVRQEYCPGKNADLAHGGVAAVSH